MEQDRDRVRRIVEDRRLALNLNFAELSRRSGLAINTLRDFVYAKSWPQKQSRAALETALGWPIGTLDRMAEGHPIPSGDMGSEAAAEGDSPTTVGRPGGADFTVLLSHGWRDGLEDEDVEFVLAQLNARAYELARAIRLENEERHKKQERPQAE